MMQSSPQNAQDYSYQDPPKNINVFECSTLDKFINQAFGSLIKSRRLSKTAKAMGFKDTSSLTKILNHQRLPGKGAIHKIAQYLQLTPAEEMHLHHLTAKEKIDVKPTVNSPIVSTKLPHHIFKQLSAWTIPAIKELSNAPSFTGKLSDIKKALRFRASDENIAKSLDTLSSIGLFRFDPHGVPRDHGGYVESLSDVPDWSIRAHHKQMLGLSLEALEKQDVTIREFGSLTLLLNTEMLAEAKADIRKFKQSFLEKYESKHPYDHRHDVYQLNMNLFALTENVGQQAINKEGES